jgi:hypothetical protein
MVGCPLPVILVVVLPIAVAAAALAVKGMAKPAGKSSLRAARGR